MSLSSFLLLFLSLPTKYVSHKPPLVCTETNRKLDIATNLRASGHSSSITATNSIAHGMAMIQTKSKNKNYTTLNRSPKYKINGISIPAAHVALHGFDGFRPGGPIVFHQQVAVLQQPSAPSNGKKIEFGSSLFQNLTMLIFYLISSGFLVAISFLWKDHTVTL